MSKGEWYDWRAVLKAVEGSGGIVSVVAQRVGCTRATVRRYRKRYASIDKAMLEERGRIIDLAEAKLFAHIDDGDRWAVKFLLTTLGRDRGYAPTQDVNLSGVPAGVGIMLPQRLAERDANVVAELLAMASDDAQTKARYYRRQLEQLDNDEQANASGGDQTAGDE